MTPRPESPYKGLVPFEDSDLDALLFFGRERESEIIAANVLAARLTVLYGPSGVGKTSVLRAGVAHHLRGEARANMEKQGNPEFAVVVFDTWSDDPVSGLLAAVRAELSDLFGSALLDEREGESLADTLARWTDALACDLLLILDQAEEYFLYHAEEAGLVDELPDLVTRAGLQVRVLLSIRDDALSKLDRFKGRIPSLFGNYLRLDHLDRRSARDAIVKPVDRYNELTGESVDIEPELIEAVLDETAAGQVDLGETGRGLAAGEAGAGRIEAAHLQLVLERVWEEERQAGSSLLRAEALARLGGSEAIVRTHLRRAVEDLSPEEKDLAADVFRHLVTPSGAKIAHGAGDLAEYASVDERRLLPVLATLGRERIVRTVDGAGTNGARYEIFHDVLGDAVLAWRREQELERERREAARRHRRLLLVAVAALVGLAVMAAVAVYALAVRSDARASARAARASAQSARGRELAALAQSDLSTDPLHSIGVALQAAKLEPSAATEDVLRNSLIASKVRRILRAGGPVNAAAYSPDGTRVVTASDDGVARVFRARDGTVIATLRHRKGVTAASFSADGRWILTASRDRTARLWTASGRWLRTFRHGGAVLDAALTPDSSMLVTIADDATVHEWSLSDLFRPRVYQEPRAARRIAISADSRRAAVVGGDRFARIYDLVSGRLLYSLPHDGQVLSAAFGPSAVTLATGSTDDLGRTWDLRTQTVAHVLQGHAGNVVDVAISPHGQFVATASSDGTADVWTRGRLIVTLLGHSNPVNDVAFSRDGLSVVTASRDGTARVWDTKHGVLRTVLAGHQGPVPGASFSPTGATVLTYSEDGTARIWDAGVKPELGVLGRHRRPVETLDLTKTLALTASRDGTARIWKFDGSGSIVLHHRGPVRDAAFSPDGRLVVTASTDHTARIWRASGSPLWTLHHPAAVDSAVFSSDSRLVATASADGRVRLWNAQSGQLMIRALPAFGPLAFSPDGKYLASAGANDVVDLWITETGKLERAFKGHRKLIIALAFSPDGGLLLSGSKDKTARLWDISSKRVRKLSGHSAALTSARFSPDGTLVATASEDHDVRLWDGRTGHRLGRLSGHYAVVSDATFSDDGRWLVTAGPRTAGLWEVGSHKLVSLLRGPFQPQLRAAAFAPGTHTIVTAGDDGTVRIYVCEVCADVQGLERLAAARLSEVANRK